LATLNDRRAPEVSCTNTTFQSFAISIATRLA
jgi:hypothetical protein